MSPFLVLHICNTMKIPATYLDQYVRDRANVLSSNDLIKLDILTAINTDNSKQKRSNDYYNCFIFELVAIKSAILKQIDMKTDIENSPDSSKINICICEIENELLTKAS